MINNVNVLQFTPCTRPLSSNSLLINVLLPPLFFRKQIVLKLHQPAHQQRGARFSCKVTYHCKKISLVAHARATTSPNHTYYPPHSLLPTISFTLLLCLTHKLMINATPATTYIYKTTNIC